MKKKMIILFVFLFVLPMLSSLEYGTGEKNISLKYILNGEINYIDFVVYGGVADYLSGLPDSIRYEEGQEPSKVDFALRNINEPLQREYLLPLVDRIKGLDRDSVDQMRIAVSIVQNLDYGGSGENISFIGGETLYSRYPYEVLYDGSGLCGEKTELLLFLLKELGYGTSFFYFPNENHEALGVECSKWRDFKGTGYCFIETTGPSIITDSSIEYVGGITLNSEPKVYPMSEGNSLPFFMKEYRHARAMRKIRHGGFTFFNKQKKLGKLRWGYGLVEEYHLA